MTKQSIFQTLILLILNVSVIYAEPPISRIARCKPSKLGDPIISNVNGRTLFFSKKFPGGVSYNECRTNKIGLSTGMKGFESIYDMKLTASDTSGIIIDTPDGDIRFDRKLPNTDKWVPTPVNGTYATRTSTGYQVSSVLGNFTHYFKKYNTPDESSFLLSKITIKTGSSTKNPFIFETIIIRNLIGQMTSIVSPSGNKLIYRRELGIFKILAANSGTSDEFLVMEVSTDPYGFPLKYSFQGLDLTSRIHLIPAYITRANGSNTGAIYKLSSLPSMGTTTYFHRRTDDYYGEIKEVQSVNNNNPALYRIVQFKAEDNVFGPNTRAVTYSSNISNKKPQLIFDEKKRVIESSIVGATGSANRFSYSPTAGTLTESTHELNNLAFQYSHNSQGALERVVRTTDGKTIYEAVLDEKTGILPIEIYAEGATPAFMSYDDFGRMTSLNANGSVTTQSFTENKSSGTLESCVSSQYNTKDCVLMNRKGQITKIENLLLQESSANQTTIFSYDNQNRLSGIKELVGNELTSKATYSYNSRNHPISQSYSNLVSGENEEYTSSYFAGNGAIKSSSDSSGNSASFAYEENGMLKQINTSSSTPLGLVTHQLKIRRE